jgi:hypothetical protein
MDARFLFDFAAATSREVFAFDVIDLVLKPLEIFPISRA